MGLAPLIAFCLRLRFSPRLFAEAAPEIFVWDESTNLLRLRENGKPPWIREFKNTLRKDNKTWLYCAECKDRYCSDKGQRNRAVIPFRDKASQLKLRPHRQYDDILDASELKEQATQPEPEEEPQEDEMQPQTSEGEAQLLEGVVEDDSEGDAELPFAPEDRVPDMPAPVQMPTLAEYESKWDAKLKHHARECPGDFSLQNLVPKPVPRLGVGCVACMRPLDLQVHGDALRSRACLGIHMSGRVLLSLRCRSCGRIVLTWRLKIFARTRRNGCFQFAARRGRSKFQILKEVSPDMLTLRACAISEAIRSFSLLLGGPFYYGS